MAYRSAVITDYFDRRSSTIYGVDYVRDLDECIRAGNDLALAADESDS